MYKKLALWVLFFVITYPVHSQVRRALIVAIGDYPTSGGWPVISSSNDVAYLKRTLQRQGFEDKNISIISDSKATRAGIDTALKKFSSQLKKSDIAVIHFSCHGVQIEDDNGDEADGLDEALVPYDAVYSGENGNFSKDTANYFRDDVFGKYVEQIRGTLGKEGDLLVLLNACHSGSGTRGFTRSRGGKPPLVSGRFLSQPVMMESQKLQLFKDSEDKETGLSTFIVISAASSGERDLEIKDEKGLGVGSLTYSFSVAMEQLSEQVSYRNLFSKIQSVMLEKYLRQHPVMEGNGIDRALFGGDYKKQQPYFEIARRLNTREYVLKAGRLAGLDIGAKVAVYPATTEEIQGLQPLSSGTVTESTQYTSTIKLGSNPQLAQITAGRVFLIDPIFKVPSITVKVDTKKVLKGIGYAYTEVEAEEIRKAIVPVQVTTADTKADLLLKKGRKGDSLFLAMSGLLFSYREGGLPGIIEWMQSALVQYSQFVFIRDLQMADKKAAIEVILVPVKNGEADTAKVLAANNIGMLRFKEGDSAKLWIRNNSQYRVYINILDLQPDGIINAILPKKSEGIYPEDCIIKAGESRVIDNYFIRWEQPYGTEVFKIFSSRSEMDMEEIIVSKGRGNRGERSYIEKLMKKTFDINVRGDAINSTGTQEGSVSNLIFEIIPVKKK